MGTDWEYRISYVLQMLMFHVIRSYSSWGTADLIASPPKNPAKNYRALLIQAKNQKAEDYISPIERDRLNYLQDINAGLVCIVYRDKNSNVMVNHNGERQTFEMFMAKQYHISCNFKHVYNMYKKFRRPIHLYRVDQEEYISRTGTRRYKVAGSFQDWYSVKPYYPYVPHE